jgi:PAS domain-containing protein
MPPAPDLHPEDPSVTGRSPILPRNVTTSQAELEQRLLATLDAIDEPVAIGSTIRDRDGRILDFRFEYVNPAAAKWAGAERQTLIGLITGDLLPGFRASGYFDVLREVVETGQPYSREDALVAGTVAGGSWVGGIYDLRAIRLGDGFLTTWRLRTASPAPEPG